MSASPSQLSSLSGTTVASQLNATAQASMATPSKAVVVSVLDQPTSSSPDVVVYSVTSTSATPTDLPTAAKSEETPTPASTQALTVAGGQAPLSTVVQSTAVSQSTSESISTAPNSNQAMTTTKVQQSTASADAVETTAQPITSSSMNKVPDTQTSLSLTAVAPASSSTRSTTDQPIADHVGIMTSSSTPVSTVSPEPLTSSTGGGLIIATGNPKSNTAANANSAEGSTTAKVGNLSVYGLVGIIAAVLVIAVGSFIAWDKWRKKKIAAVDPFGDVGKPGTPQPPVTSQTTSQGSVLGDPMYFPGQPQHPADKDGTSSFWNESRSAQVPQAYWASKNAPADLSLIPSMTQSGGQFEVSDWLPSLPTPSGSLYTRDPNPTHAMPFRESVKMERGQCASDALLGSQWAPKDGRRLTANTALTGLTSTSSHLDMMSTFASDGDEAASRVSPSMSPWPEQSRFTQMSASSTYSTEGGGNPPTPRFAPSPSSGKHLSKFARSFKPLPDTDEVIEQIAFDSDESAVDPFSDGVGGTARRKVARSFESDDYPMTMPKRQ